MGDFGNHLESQDHRRRKEQGRKSSLDEDDSKRKPKRGIGCLKGEFEQFLEVPSILAVISLCLITISLISSK